MNEAQWHMMACWLKSGPWLVMRDNDWFISQDPPRALLFMPAEELI